MKLFSTQKPRLQNFKHFVKPVSQNRHGYTLVELAVAALIVALMVAGMARWLVDVGQVSTAISTGTDSSVVVLSKAQLQDDLMQLDGCSYTGIDAQVREVSEFKIEILSRENMNAPLFLVVWDLMEFDDQWVLRRGQAEMDLECTEPVVDMWSIQTIGLDEGSRFSVVRDGVSDLGGTLGACLTSYLERCQVEKIRVELYRDNRLLLDDVFVVP